jgi:hypothetical protein
MNKKHNRRLITTAVTSQSVAKPTAKKGMKKHKTYSKMVGTSSLSAFLTNLVEAIVLFALATSLELEALGERISLLTFSVFVVLIDLLS